MASTVPTRFEVERALIKSALPAAARHIVLTLAIWTDADTAIIRDEFSKSLSEIAAATGLGRSTVARHLKSLEKTGWVERARPEYKAARGGAKTSYALCLVPERDGKETHLTHITNARPSLRSGFAAGALRARRPVMRDYRCEDYTATLRTRGGNCVYEIPRCFRCNELGHIKAECLSPTSPAKSPAAAPADAGGSKKKIKFETDVGGRRRLVMDIPGWTPGPVADTRKWADSIRAADPRMADRGESRERRLQALAAEQAQDAREIREGAEAA